MHSRFRNIMHRSGQARFLLPLVLMLGYFIPPLREPIHGLPSNNTLTLILAAELFLIFIWILSEFIVLTSRLTTIFELQADDLISVLVAIIVSLPVGFYLGCMIVGIAEYRLQWWLVMPWLGAVVDGCLSGILCINNAAQKPFAPNPRSQ